MSEKEVRWIYRLWCAKHRRVEEHTSRIRANMMYPLNRGCDGREYTWTKIINKEAGFK